MLKIYNSLTKSKDKFEPYKKGEVNFYTCGFTVYDHTHIGSIKKYVGDDTIRRGLEFLGYKVKHVQNVTDVGHLTSDADEGEDKLEKGAKKHNKTPQQVAREFENEFYTTMDAVNNLRPHVIVRAADEVAIKSQISKIQTLIDKDYAYVADSAVYFDVSKLKDYNPFSNQPLDQKLKGSREDLVSDIQKRNPADFALWVFTKGVHEHHIMRWGSPWGTGFPGWHIECSAISLDNLNNKIDIHTGGVDHKEIHHPNEIAQNIGICNHPVVKVWVHHEFLLVDNKKMSKSLGNFYTLKDIEVKGFTALELRYFMLQAHYRSQLNFTFEALQNAANGYKNLRRKVGELSVSKGKDIGNLPDNLYYHQFAEALEDDFNIPKALSILWEVVDSQQLDDGTKYALVKEFDKVLGLQITVWAAKVKPLVIAVSIPTVEAYSDSVPKEVVELVKRRGEARAQKNYQLSDELREKILDMGFEVEDTSEGTKILKI